ncbi:MAG: hypothetical protein LCH76_04250 [Actinobacteria bacterium]|nr:hypothetical protein [Actinomycetota bacterium]
MVLFDLGSDIVTPSWLPLAMAGLLLVVLGLLFVSLRHHLRKINVPGNADAEPPVEGESRGSR